MRRSIVLFFTPPVFPDDEAMTRQAQVLFILLATDSVIIAIGALATVTVVANKIGAGIAFGVLLIRLLIAYAIARRGQVRQASWLWVGGMWLVTTLVVLLSGRLGNFLVTFPLAVAVVTGILLGSRPAVLFTAVSCLVLLGVALFELSGAPPIVAFPGPPLAQWVGLLMAFVFTIVPLLLTLQSLDTALARTRKSERRYATLFEVAPVMALILRDQDGVPLIAACNDTFLHTLGYRREQVLGQVLSRFYPPASATALVEAQAPQRLTTASPSIERELVAVDGRLLPTLLQIAPERDAAGQVTGVLAMYLDITEQKRVEEQLRESQIQVALAVSGADLGTWDWDVPTGRIVFNERWAEILGYTLADLAPVSIQTWRDLCQPADLEEAEALLQQTFAQVSDRYECEIRMRHKCGAWVWVNTCGKVVERDADGAPVRMAGIHLDITARKQAELGVRRLSRTYQVLSAVNAAIIHMRDPQALFETACRIAVEQGGFRMAWVGLVDPLARRVIPVASAGATAQYLEGLNVDLDDPVRGRGPTGTAVHTGTCQVVNAIAHDPQMTPWRANALALGYQSSVAFPLIVAGAVAGVLNLYAREPDSFDAVELRLYNEMALDLAFALEGIAREEQRQQLEQALWSERNSLARRVDERTAELSRTNAELARAVRAKDEFLAMMSHELRSPLTAILGYSESLQEGLYDPLTQQQQTAIHHVEASGRHLLALINDILDLSKIEAGRLDLQPEVVLIADVCQFSLLFVREVAVKQQLQLDFQLNDQDAQMSADPKRLKQILVNLLSNAVKFTEIGGRVCLEVVADAAAGVVTFAVQDSGIGIAPEDLARLFQPFTQLDSHLSRQHTGTGLGLSLVRRLAELHGGSVAVESEPGVGSRFTVALPYTPAAEAPKPAPTPTGSTASLRSALVIEDSAVSCEQLARYLGELNIHATIYPEGAGALEAIARLRPDVIILDLLMPGESGWEVLTRLKADAELRAIPVIIVSVVDERARGLAAGATEHLVKPITREGLRRALELAAASGELRREPAREAAIIAPVIGPAVDRVRILLAEDNDFNINTIGDYLQAQGYQLTIARNGREALVMAAEMPPDLILMDIQMPEMDGLEATRQLRVIPAFAATPIIALTALAMPGDRERCLEAGANEYLTKPVRLKTLVETIRRLL